jgi:hypothetical protein
MRPPPAAPVRQPPSSLGLLRQSLCGVVVADLLGPSLAGSSCARNCLAAVVMPGRVACGGGRREGRWVATDLGPLESTKCGYRLDRVDGTQPEAEASRFGLDGSMVFGGWDVLASADGGVPRAP